MGLKAPSSTSSHQTDPSSASVSHFIDLIHNQRTRPDGAIASSAQQPSKEQLEILTAFRSELESEGHLQEGETLGTDDETLLYGFISILICWTL